MNDDTIELRQPAGDPVSLRAYAAPIAAAFGETIDDAEFDSELDVFEADRAIGAVDGEAWVGGGAAYSFRLTVPGRREVGAAGITGVGVRPDYRRRGILTRMMGWLLDQAAERGEPVAVLRATVCMHLAPTASRRIYQQRVGRVTRRHPGKEAGIVMDFVHPATKHDDPVVTLHSLLDRDVYRGGAIVVGPVRRGRGRRVRVERRVLPVTADPDRRAEVFERELWRIAVEHLDYGEQHVWAALAGARVAPNGWRRAQAMLHFDHNGELRRRYLITAVQRNRNHQIRLRALQEIAASRDAEAFDRPSTSSAGWPRDERREGVKVMLQALAERQIGRRDQANAWIWRMAEYTREVHEEYAVQRWPETKRLLGLLVNSSGAAHARNARRLVHAARKQDRRLAAGLLAAALAHTPEAEEVLRGARTRMARKPAALARELLRNFPKGRRGRGSRRRRRKGDPAARGRGRGEGAAAVANGAEAARTTRSRARRVRGQRHEADEARRARQGRRGSLEDEDEDEYD